jgi:hypothetical protein
MVALFLLVQNQKDRRERPKEGPQIYVAVKVFEHGYSSLLLRLFRRFNLGGSVNKGTK